MADGSTIEWLQKPGFKGATWNPTRGCARQGAGCDHCWAIGQARRQDTPGGAYEGLTTIRNGRVDWLGTARPAPDMLDLPLHWKNPRCVFVESMGDLWHPGISFDYIAAVFGVMAATPQHFHIVLTKQARRMREWFGWIEQHPTSLGGPTVNAARGVRWHAWHYIDDLRVHDPEQPWVWPLPNVALLVSAWDQPSAEKYVPHLLATPAAVRGVSAEPLLGPLDLTHLDADRAGHRDWCQINSLTGRQTDMGRPCPDVPARIDWVIVGGESGNGARPMQADWARSLREQCREAGVAFFFKQWGNYAPNEAGELVKLRSKKEGGRVLDGRTWDEFP